MAASVTVRWNPSLDKVTSYRVYRAAGSGAFSLIGTVTPPSRLMFWASKTLQLVDRNVKRGVTYRYYVTAVAKVESKPSNTATVTVK
jgi:hypothetical protein